MMKSMTKTKELLLRIIAAAVLMAVLAILPLKNILCRVLPCFIPYFTVGHDISSQGAQGNPE